MSRNIITHSLLIFLFLFEFSCFSQDIENPKVKWQFKTQGAVRSTPVILNKTIYFGSSDDYIYALNKENGALIWKYKTNGAVVSKPEISNNSLYVSSRDHNLYSINIKDGSLNWKFKMGENLRDDNGGWKYFMASPKVKKNNVFIGSGDGHIYAIDVLSGKLNWKYKTNGRIRATPLIHQNKIYQPSNDGYVYVLNLNGVLNWKFATIGTTYNPNDYPFDRSSIIAQPLIKDNILIIASRDGNTYGINLKTHKKTWNFNYGNTWAMSTNISDNTVFVGWSTNDKFCALDLISGKKIWDYKTKGHNFPKALISKTSVYTTSSDGNLYRLNKQTGEKIWHYSTGKEIYSSPIYDTETIFFGSDNGYLYAINNGQKPYKIVYQPIDGKGNFKNPKVSNEIVPFLVEKGFKHISDENDLQAFIDNRLDDKTPSVIVFPYLIIPKNIIGTNPKKGLMRQYLDTGGKVIWPGDVPNYYERDKTGKQIRSEDIASKLLDVTFNNPKEFGIYFSKTTQEGRNWGLPQGLKTLNSSVIMNSKDIIPLAYDEFKNVSIWMKKFNARIGSGYVSSRTWGGNTQIKETDLELLYKIAVYGLE